MSHLAHCLYFSPADKMWVVEVHAYRQYFPDKPQALAYLDWVVQEYDWFIDVFPPQDFVDHLKRRAAEGTDS